MVRKDSLYDLSLTKFIEAFLWASMWSTLENRHLRKVYRMLSSGGVLCILSLRFNWYIVFAWVLYFLVDLGVHPLLEVGYLNFCYSFFSSVIIYFISFGAMVFGAYTFIVIYVFVDDLPFLQCLMFLSLHTFWHSLFCLIIVLMLSLVLFAQNFLFCCFTLNLFISLQLKWVSFYTIYVDYILHPLKSHVFPLFLKSPLCWSLLLNGAFKHLHLK